MFVLTRMILAFVAAYALNAHILSPVEIRYIHMQPAQAVMQEIRNSAHRADILLEMTAYILGIDLLLYCKGDGFPSDIYYPRAEPVGVIDLKERVDGCLFTAETAV